MHEEQSEKRDPTTLTLKRPRFNIIPLDPVSHYEGGTGGQAIIYKCNTIQIINSPLCMSVLCYWEIWNLMSFDLLLWWLYIYVNTLSNSCVTVIVGPRQWTVLCIHKQEVFSKEINVNRALMRLALSIALTKTRH